MAVALTYPGVYVQELPSGVHTIVGVATSIGMFLGRAKKGELFKALRCESFADFERGFSTDYADSDLAREVKLFYDNGGSECYVMRIADPLTVTTASLMILDEAGVNTLQVAAKSAGSFGNDIRVSIDYDTAAPEDTFNLDVFRWVTSSTGALQKSQIETYSAISMDPANSRYCEDVVNLASALITITDQRKAVALTGTGSSISGFAISSSTNAVFQAVFATLLTATQNKFRLTCSGFAPALIDLSSVIASLPFASVGALATALTNTINAQLPPGAHIVVTFPAGPAGPGGQNNSTSQLMMIEWDTAAGGTADIYVESAPSQDLAGPLMLGPARGGVEITRAGARRPAPNGVVFHSDFQVVPNAYTVFGETVQASIDAVRVAGLPIALTAGTSLQTTPAPVVSPRMYQDKNATTQDDGRDGVREKFARIASAINNRKIADSTFQWSAEVWNTRLAIVAAGDIGDLTTTTLEAGTFGPPFVPVLNVFDGAGQPVTQNVRYYALASPPPPPGAFYTAGVVGTDGGPPQLQDYDAAYQIIDREVDLFNLLVLPHDAGHNNATTRALWGPASTFCERRRAFLLMDPPADWIDQNSATDATIGVNSLRVGLSKQYSAVYFPNITIREGIKEIAVGPSGAIAGIMARIDGTRGVWKSAAGIEADLRGIVGVQRRFSDAENGVMNPHAVNTIRNFPNGIVSWGARTMDGDDTFGSEYKYSCVRRLANFMEESLYRGLKWAVFEPNAEPLWASIRLNVGAFMHDLFRQGAFAGETPKDAYFVRCDSTTTTQNDVNLGIVNIIVGFAPLKPAEFVVLYLQQMAGKILT